MAAFPRWWWWRWWNSFELNLVQLIKFLYKGTFYHRLLLLPRKIKKLWLPQFAKSSSPQNKISAQHDNALIGTFQRNSPQRRRRRRGENFILKWKGMLSILVFYNMFCSSISCGLLVFLLPAKKLWFHSTTQHVE